MKPTDEQIKAVMRELGSRTTPAKARASRANGKKGGRPRKEQKTMNHKHRALPSKSKTMGYTGSVNPYRPNPSAHGCCCHIDYCACGATRSTNVNGNHVERGQWKEQKQ